MILIRQLKVAVSEQETEGIRQAVAKKIHITVASIYEIEILKRSIDARKKPDLFYIYTVAVRLDIHQEKKLLKKCAKDTDISLYGTGRAFLLAFAGTRRFFTHPFGKRTRSRR